MQLSETSITTINLPINRGPRQVRFANSRINGSLAVTYKKSKGELVIKKLFNGSFQRQEKTFSDVNVDLVPNKLVYTGRGSIMASLAADTCQWCRASRVELEMHHILKLKDLKGKGL